MNSFTCLTLNPMGLSHSGLALATVKAGGIGILDTEFFRGTPAAVLQTLKPLVNLKTPDRIGIRLCADLYNFGVQILKILESKLRWVILSQWTETTLQPWLSLSVSHRLVVEITHKSQLDSLGSIQSQLGGILLKGHESGGWVGEDSAYLLLQRALKVIDPLQLPLYVQGGIGLHTAAACRALGVAGVVLDDQLWFMPESPLPTHWQRSLLNLNGQEAILIGERLNCSCRVLGRPGFKVVSDLQVLADQIEVAQGSSVQAAQDWYQASQPLIGWGDPSQLAWPVGQAVGLAQPLAEHFSTTGRLIQAIMRSSLDHLKLAQALQPFQPESPLAQAHHTRFPIVQGPMTRVSDTAEFAQSVAAAGGLPLLALALMPGAQVETLLKKTQALLGDHAWGVGMLGFISHSLREEQLQALQAVPPAFALIAGGRPDQAAHFEAMGTSTYIHVPVPKLLKLFLEQGARKFVFEGRECGGHVGPLSSFILWESMIQTLLMEVTAEQAPEIHVLFAGGIHDAVSAMMVGVMTAPLVARGMKVGVLMGTAYLFTEEATSGGAICAEFQKQALACERTINLESGPGHATRCAVTPFAHEFYETRRRMMATGQTPETIKTTLEDLNIGRLRIASKGLTRDPSGTLIQVSPQQQVAAGMYMIGQVATLRHEVTTVQSLHEDVSLGSCRRIQALDLTDIPSPHPTTQPADIAIVGIATFLPKANDPNTFWCNIMQKVDAIAEIPPDRWDWHLYYDPDPSTPDKVYSKWGGFIDPLPFDPVRFGIPPKSLKSISPMQLLALEAVRQALADAGYESGNFDREHTSVILGISGGLGDLGEQFAARAELPRLLESPNPTVWERLPEWTSDTFPGVLLNVTAGRIANRFDLGGSNFTVDAACASSLSAIHLAVNELETGRANVAIAGGVDTEQSPFSYFCFAKTQALSPQGRSRSFDATADGICISEGIGVVVLKRLADAERDGDRIYAVIKAVAGSSDGKALGLTAPLPAGQRRALDRAYEKAGFAPSTLGLYEAHGTGTVAGDRAELATIVTTLKDHQTPPKTCALGSVKTMIGHTKSTAGVAAMVKVALALHYRVLPPHIHVETPLPPISDPESPVYLLKEPQPWLDHPDYPRRGAISAFGFGGTNFHAVLEEYRGNLLDPVGNSQWPCELLVFRGDDQATLLQSLQALQQALTEGAKPKLQDLAFSLALAAQAQAAKPLCLALVTSDLADLLQSLNWVIQAWTQPSSPPLPPYIQFQPQVQEPAPTLAFLFPGQGSQYPMMLREPALYISELREALELADQSLQPYLSRRLSQWIYPPAAYSEAEEKDQKKQLQDTRVAQCALGTIAIGLLDFLKRLGIQPAMVGGHSYGEYVALHTAGVISRHHLFELSRIRGAAMAEACTAGKGIMASIQAQRETVLQAIQAFNLVDQVVIANHNAPTQSVISGDRAAVIQLAEALAQKGFHTKVLGVSGAFHSKWVDQAQERLVEAILATPFAQPQIKVYANSTGSLYASDPATIQQTLSQHMLSSVEFVTQIQHMYAEGATLFLEVGPKRVLTHLVNEILADQPHQALALDQGTGLRGLLSVVGTLITQGVSVDLPALFRGRDCQALDISRLRALAQPPQVTSTTHWVNGGGVRSQQADSFQPGNQPFLTAATILTDPTLGSNRGSESSTPTPPAPLTASTGFDYGLPLSSQGVRAPMISPTTSQFGYSTPANETSYPTTGTPMMSGDLAFAAYQSYQETMRHFLSVQERVMMQFLASQSGRGVSGSLGSLAYLPPTPAPLSAPIQSSQPRYSIPQTVNGHPQTDTTSSEDLTPPQPVVPTQPLVQSIPSLTQSTPQPVNPALAQIQLPQLTRESTTPPASPTPLTQPAATSQTITTGSDVTLDQTSLTDLLVSLVSDLTGYPTDMLGLDQDLEAELGIDSIKRVEIMGSLRKRLPDTLASTLQEKMETFTKVKTLQGVVDQLINLKPQEGNGLGKSSPRAQPRLAT